MTVDWLLRVGDGENFKNSSKYGIYLMVNILLRMLKRGTDCGL